MSKQADKKKTTTTNLQNSATMQERNQFAKGQQHGGQMAKQ